MQYTIGLDIGGTKIAAGLIDQKGDVVSSVKLPSMTENATIMFEQVLKTIESLISQSQCSKKDIKGIGIGLPGKVDRITGTALYQNNLPWGNYPVKDKLQVYYPDLSIKIDNDVAVAALGEYHVNRAGENELFTYITLSTGVASASIINDQLLLGKGFSGELGLIPVRSGLEAKEALVPLEKCTSGTAIQAYGRKLYNDPTLSTKDVFDRYYDNDETAVYILGEVASSLSQGFSSIISLLDPHMIIIGGSVATHHPVLIDLIRHKLNNSLIEAQKEAVERIKVSETRDAALIGAASLVAKNK